MITTTMIFDLECDVDGCGNSMTVEHFTLVECMQSLIESGWATYDERCFCNCHLHADEEA